jgi:hypothetical protein
MQEKVASALVVALVLMLMLGVAGCGGGGSTRSDTRQPASFKADVRTVCDHVSTQIQALSKLAKTDRSAALTKIGAVMTRGIAQFEAIDAPKAMQARYARFKAGVVAHRGAVLELAKADPHLTKAEQVAVEDHHNPTLIIAHELGIDGCG